MKNLVFAHGIGWVSGALGLVGMVGMVGIGVGTVGIGVVGMCGVVSRRMSGVVGTVGIGVVDNQHIHKFACSC